MGLCAYDVVMGCHCRGALQRLRSIVPHQPAGWAGGGSSSAGLWVRGWRGAEEVLQCFCSSHCVMVPVIVMDFKRRSPSSVDPSPALVWLQGRAQGRTGVRPMGRLWFTQRVVGPVSQLLRGSALATRAAPLPLLHYCSGGRLAATQNNTTQQHPASLCYHCWAADGQGLGSRLGCNVCTMQASVQLALKRVECSWRAGRFSPELLYILCRLGPSLIRPQRERERETHYRSVAHRRTYSIASASRQAKFALKLVGRRGGNSQMIKHWPSRRHQHALGAHDS